MDTYDGLCNKIGMMRQSLFDEGYVVSSQFQLLEKLQDEKNPNFLQEIFSLYFRDTIRQFGEIEKMIYQEPEGEHKKDMLNRFIYRLKGSVLRIVAAFEQVKLLAQVRPYEKADSPESQTGSSVTVEIPKSPGEVEVH
ncbi:unnamed protein product [Lupinus luteus]|uniref:Histidine-containing phosphotransfer protein n=1 Tax=Lupinus luteus TaxID=3873 RepID=A0AAV1XLX5_LUPLU